MSKTSRKKNRNKRKFNTTAVIEKTKATATTEEPKGNFKKINFATADTKLSPGITADSIPTLTPNEKLSSFMDGDSSPYYKVQEIPYPLEANGYLYKESFFESFLSKLSERPTPGSKDGHEPRWGVRPKTDLLLVGGKVEKNGDGTGKVFLKNYIPPKLNSDNEAFIKEAKADMIHFSLVSYTRDEIISNADGSREYHVVESITGERNDAVEYNTGAMEQKTNTNKPETASSTVEDNKTNQGEKPMEELIKKLLTFKQNGDLNVTELAKTLGMELRTEDDKKNASSIAKYEAAVGSIEDAEKLATGVKANATKVMEAEIVKLFGDVKINGNDNRANQYASNILKDSMESGDMDKFNAKVEELKKDPIAIELKAAHVDPFSKENAITGESMVGGEKKENEPRSW